MKTPTAEKAHAAALTDLEILMGKLAEARKECAAQQIHKQNRLRDVALGLISREAIAGELEGIAASFTKAADLEEAVRAQQVTVREAAETLEQAKAAEVDAKFQALADKMPAAMERFESNYLAACQSYAEAKAIADVLFRRSHPAANAYTSFLGRLANDRSNVFRENGLRQGAGQPVQIFPVVPIEG